MRRGSHNSANEDKGTDEAMNALVRTLFVFAASSDRPQSNASLFFGPALLLLENHGQYGVTAFPNHEPSQLGANFIAFPDEQHILLRIILFHVITLISFGRAVLV
jgi:hypothetical protein